MHARSALFDLYGDHLGSRGGEAPVASLVRLLAPLGIAPPAVRTAVSRMVRQGWLAPATMPGGPGYRLTAKGSTRLDQAADRVYRLAAPAWDGHWHLLVIDRVESRTARERLRAGLAFLGYGVVGESTWVAPRPSPEVDALLAADRVQAQRFTATHEGADTTRLVRRAWDLESLAAAYSAWLADARQLVASAGSGTLPDDEVFAVRSVLVHEWRKFLFTDPGLPRELLPEGWPGERAARYFATEAERMRPAADRFVDSCLP